MNLQNKSNKRKADVMRYGLIGETLKHSWSKYIHEQLADYTYDLIPLSKDELHSFLSERNFNGINVTIPYKETVIPYLDVIEEQALQIGSVNTIVQRDGLLYGYNTDYWGFLYTLEKNKIELTNKKCIILGSGGAHKAVYAVVQSCNASEIVVVNRSLKPGVISYEECYEHHKDAQIIINTTPAGMYPHYLDQKPLDLTRFQDCTAVIDIVYNPLQTQLLQEASELGMVAINGLEMLVSQAKYAVEHFLDVTMSNECIPPVTTAILKQMEQQRND